MALGDGPDRGPGYTYFIQAGRGGPIKIGYARDPFARLAELQVGNHEELRLLLAVADNGTREMLLHERFAHLRIRGEWFRADDELEGILWIAGIEPHPETAREKVTREVLEMDRPPWDFDDKVTQTTDDKA